LNFLQKLKLAFSAAFDVQLKAFLQGDDLPLAFNGHDKETALKLSAVFACVRVLAETLAVMPIKVYRKEPNGNKIEANNIAVTDMLQSSPNDEMSIFTYKETAMANLVLGGNTYALKYKNKIGETVGLYPMQYDTVSVERHESTKELVYKVKDGRNTKVYAKTDIFHIPGLSLNGVTGLTPIEYHATATELGLMQELFGTKFYRNGAHSTGILRHPGKLVGRSADEFRKQFAERQQGLANAGKPILLEEGMEFQQLTIKPTDSQYLESRRFQVEDIARIYRVPLHLLQNLDRATNNNIEHQSLEFIMYTMLPWVKRWEDAINMQLLTPQQRRSGYFVEFLMASLMRGDQKSRYEAYATGRNWGWLSANDVRKLENMNSIDGGDEYLTPLNMGTAGSPDAKDKGVLL
jgi:HK97 family phage portal protein